MLQIAKNPGTNVAALYTLSSATAPFQPSLSAAPNDFSLGITFNAGLSYPGPIAIDNSGDVYVANCPTCNGVAGTDSVMGFTPAGVARTGTAFTANIHKPTAIALDRYNSVWVTEAASGTAASQVTRLANDGSAVQSGFPVTLNGTPGGIALVENSPAAAFITDSTNSRLTVVNSDGTTLAGINTNTLANPTAIAADGLENLYIISNGSTNIVKYTPIYDRSQQYGTLTPTNNGTLSGNFTTLTGATAGVSAPSGLAIDGGAHVWTVNTGTTKSVSELFGVTGAATSSATGYTGINTANSISIDGAGTAWIANCRSGCTGSGSTAADNIVHLSATGTSLTTTSDGYQNASLAHPTGSAIDASGNLWITNTSGASITELVGVAVPVILETQTASSRHALPAVNYLRNPSFELGTGSSIAGWTVTGSATAGEDNGSPFSGQQKLTFYSGAAFTTTVSQTVAVPNGNYLVSCYIASAPNSTTRTTSLIVSGYGSGTSTLTTSPTDLTYTFQPYSVVGVPVTNGSLTLGLYNNETYAGGGYAGFDSCSVTRQ